MPVVVNGTSYEIFTVPMAYPIKHGRKIDGVINDYGDGYDEVIVNSTTWGPRSDGLGTQSSYKGVNQFTIARPKSPYGVGKIANDLLSFWQARMNENNKSFVFYVFPEAQSIDVTGATLQGRYVGRFIAFDINRVLYALQMFNYDELVVREVQP